MNLDQDLSATLLSVAQAFDALAVRWAIGGSFASTLYGEPRSTNDIDVIACLRPEHIVAFRKALGASFYLDDAMMAGAIAARESFNIIDERNFLKVDVFIPPPGALGEGQLDRRRSYDLSETGPSVFVLSAEDTVLQKLRWFELGGRASERQWRDLLAVLRLSVELDVAYMRAVAAQGALRELLEEALAVQSAP